jgi:excisionase family DNA binding protein
MCGMINTGMKTSSDFLNAKQAAKYLGFSYETVRTMFRLGQLPTIMVRTRKLTTKALLERWLEHGHEPPAAQSPAVPETKPGIGAAEFTRVIYGDQR